MGVLVINIGTDRSEKVQDRGRGQLEVLRPGRVTQEEARAVVIAAGVGELDHIETKQRTADTEGTHILVLHTQGEFNLALLRVSRALEQDCVAWMWWPYGKEGTAHCGLAGDERDDWLPFNPQYFRLPERRRAGRLAAVQPAVLPSARAVRPV